MRVVLILSLCHLGPLQATLQESQNSNECQARWDNNENAQIVSIGAIYMASSD